MTVEVWDGVCTSRFVFQHNTNALFQGLACIHVKCMHWFYFKYAVDVVCSKNGQECEFGKHWRDRKNGFIAEDFRDVSMLITAIVNPINHCFYLWQ